MGRFLPVLIAAAALFAAAGPDYLSAKKKIDLLRSHKVPAGANMVLLERELNAYVRAEAPKVAPQGIRDPRVTLGDGKATGFAYLDFPKLRQSQGQPMGWFMSRLLAGERPVKVDARVQSSGGKATVLLDRVEVSGMPLSGGALDYVIRNFLWSYYPEAKIGKPFELTEGIDRLEVRPSGVNVVMTAGATRWRRTAAR